MQRGNPSRKAMRPLAVIPAIGLAMSLWVAADAAAAGLSEPADRSAATAVANRAGVLSETEARTLATTLANRELAAKGLKGQLHASGWTVSRDDGRWNLVKVSPAGPQAWVSFDLDGSNARLKVEYAHE